MPTGKEPYLIFRGSVACDENIIGNLLLETAEAIHRGNMLAVDHAERHYFVKETPATEAEMEAHCEEYACGTCPIAERCLIWSSLKNSVC